MSKPSRRKRKTSSTPTRPPSTGPRRAVPSAQTLLRTMLLDFETRDALATRAASLDHTLLQRDQKRLVGIESAQSVEELLERVTSATGLGEHAWLKRMRAFGPSAAPVIVEWFKGPTAGTPAQGPHPPRREVHRGAALVRGSGHRAPARALGPLERLRAQPRRCRARVAGGATGGGSDLELLSKSQG